MARPIPRQPPVTTATRSFNDKSVTEILLAWNYTTVFGGASHQTGGIFPVKRTESPGGHFSLREVRRTRVTSNSQRQSQPSQHRDPRRPQERILPEAQGEQA